LTSPVYLGIVVAVAGLVVSVLFVRETHAFAHLEASRAPQPANAPAPSLGRVFCVTSVANVSLFAPVKRVW
jgi:hypothetical protein